MAVAHVFVMMGRWSAVESTYHQGRFLFPRHLLMLRLSWSSRPPILRRE